MLQLCQKGVDMNLISKTSDLSKIKASTLIKFCAQDGPKNDPSLKILDKCIGGAIRKIFEWSEFEGKLNQTSVLYPASSILVDKIILVGLGEREKINDDSYRQAAGTISRLLPVKKSKSLAFFFDLHDDSSTAQAVAEGFLLGRFDMTDYKSNDKKNSNMNESVCFYSANKAGTSAIEKGMKRGQIIANSVISARRLAFHPGNVITPITFAEEAKSISRKNRLKIRVLDEKQIKKEKMNALLAVAQGSDRPPRFVMLEYRKGKADQKPVVLIGKGITFDSGGISLKPPLDMDEMKGDMTGGAIVLATMMAISQLKIPLNVVGIIPLAENMPSGKALHPGDIIKSRKGKTIEIINTDAEGRLILADALDFANKYKPQAVIDIATLTGAALYVLGYAAAPILGNNKQLMDAIRAASEKSAEKVWEMPLWDEYRELVKSSIADLKNSGGKSAGTITAAAFLENFIGNWPWAHIDIAYVDLEKNGKPYIPKGASGFGVRLLIELLSNWKEIRK